jgi:hypothetical protein
LQVRVHLEQRPDDALRARQVDHPGRAQIANAVTDHAIPFGNPAVSAMLISHPRVPTGES